MKRRTFLSSIIGALFTPPALASLELIGVDLASGPDRTAICEWKRGIGFVNPPVMVETGEIDPADLMDLRPGRLIRVRVPVTPMIVRRIPE